MPRPAPLIPVSAPFGAALVALPARSVPYRNTYPTPVDPPVLRGSGTVFSHGRPLPPMWGLFLVPKGYTRGTGRIRARIDP